MSPGILTMFNLNVFHFHSTVLMLDIHRSLVTTITTLYDPTL